MRGHSSQKALTRTQICACKTLWMTWLKQLSGISMRQLYSAAIDSSCSFIKPGLQVIQISHNDLLCAGTRLDLVRIELIALQHILNKRAATLND